MATEVKAPVLPESVADGTIATWHKKVGDAVKRDENLLDLETDKVVLEVPSPVDGVLKEIKFEVGATVTSSQVVAIIEEGATAAAAPAAEAKQADAPRAPAPTGTAPPAVRAWGSSSAAWASAGPGPALQPLSSREVVISSAAAQVPVRPCRKEIRDIVVSLRDAWAGVVAK